MDLDELSLADLEARLAGYKDNLIAIDQAVAQDPDNEEYSQLKSELEEVITYLGDLVRMKRAEVTDLEDRQPEVERPVKAQVEVSPAVLQLIGRTCVITSTMQHGTIKSLAEIDPKTKLPVSVVVTIFGDAEDADFEELPITSVRLLNAVKKESVKIGQKCQALYGGDGAWYPAEIAEMRGDQVLVKYIDYDEAELVPLDRIRSASAKQTPSIKPTPSMGQEMKRKTVKQIVTPAGYTIPASLIVRPGDTEQQRLHKRKKLESLKKEQKAERAEADARDRQSDWKSHAAGPGAKFRIGLNRSKR